MLEFYDELRRSRKLKFFYPSFAILITNVDKKWDAPERLSELFYDSLVPKEYMVEFKYYKIVINEVPKRDLVELRNTASAVFYIENNNPVQLCENWDELAGILKEVIKKTCGAEIIQGIINRIFRIYDIDENSKLIKGIDDLVEVKNMLETRAKKWEKEVWEKGKIEGRVEGIEKTALNMIINHEPDEKITLYTGLSIEQINKIRESVKKNK